MACDSLSFLEAICFTDGYLQLIGNAGWYSRGGERVIADEQPIDASAFVLAFRERATLRGCALGILGLDAYLQHEPDNDLACTTLNLLGAALIRRFEENADEEWRWFEPELTYENALLPLALFKFSMRTGDERALRVACDSLSFLETLCFADGYLQLVGNAGWHGRGAKRVIADEQALRSAVQS